MILLDFTVQAVDLSTVQSPIDGTMTVVDALFRSHEHVGGNCREILRLMEFISSGRKKLSCLVCSAHSTQLFKDHIFFWARSSIFLPALMLPIIQEKRKWHGNILMMPSYRAHRYFVLKAACKDLYHVQETWKFSFRIHIQLFKL